MISKIQKKFFTALNHIGCLLILANTVTGCVSVSTFDSLVGISIGETNYAVGLKICAISAGIRKYKPILKKKKKW